jgi:hypothetical protein
MRGKWLQGAEEVALLWEEQLEEDGSGGGEGRLERMAYRGREVLGKMSKATQSEGDPIHLSIHIGIARADRGEESPNTRRVVRWWDEGELWQRRGKGALVGEVKENGESFQSHIKKRRAEHGGNRLQAVIECVAVTVGVIGEEVIQWRERVVPEVRRNRVRLESWLQLSEDFLKKKKISLVRVKGEGGAWRGWTLR